VFNKGLNILPISLSHLTQGLYYLELISTDTNQSIVIDLTK